MEIVAGAAVMEFHAVFRHIELAAHQRLDPRFLGLFVKLQRPVHSAVVGHRHRVHAKILGVLDQVGDADGPVKHGVLGVDVKMDEGCGHIAESELGDLGG